MPSSIIEQYWEPKKIRENITKRIDLRVSLTLKCFKIYFLLITQRKGNWDGILLHWCFLHRKEETWYADCQNFYPNTEIYLGNQNEKERFSKKN